MSHGYVSAEVNAARTTKVSLLMPWKSKPGCTQAAMAKTLPVFMWMVSGAKPLHGPILPSDFIRARMRSNE
eukprot:8261750-Pyramimonas_sp.AAC.1